MNTSITINATINANRNKVWDYYTQPEHITQWNFADPSWQCPFAANDMRVGGKYQARMEAKDGSFGFDFEATYDEIIVGERFAYTMPNGRKVTVVFKEYSQQTQMTITFDSDEEHSIERQKTAGRLSLITLNTTQKLIN